MVSILPPNPPAHHLNWLLAFKTGYLFLKLLNFIYLVVGLILKFQTSGGGAFFFFTSIKIRGTTLSLILGKQNAEEEGRSLLRMISKSLWSF